MSENIETVTIDGKKHPAIRMTPVVSQEYFNSYHLDDGTVVRIKLVAKSIFQLTGTKGPDGRPVYLLQSENVLDVTHPEES